MSEDRRNVWLCVSPKTTVLALVFFIGGIFLVTRVLWQSHMDPSVQRSPWALPLLGSLTAAALVAAFRGGVRLDSDQQELVRWRGVFFPLWSRRIPFAGIRSVAVSAGLRPGSPQAARERSYSYNVAILVGSRHLVVRWTKSLDDAVAKANIIGKTVGCKVERWIDLDGQSL